MKYISVKGFIKTAIISLASALEDIKINKKEYLNWKDLQEFHKALQKHHIELTKLD